MRLLFVLLLAPTAAQEGDLERLIGQLASDSPAIREQAAVKLRRMGDDAAPRLREALAHPDAEVRARLNEIIRRIEWDGTINPGLLSRYPPLKDAFEQGAHSELLDFGCHHPAWSSWFSEGFEAYAIKLLGGPDIPLRKRGAGILHQRAGHFDRVPGVCRRPVRELVSRIVSWDPELDQDRDRNYLACLTETLFVLSSRRDRSELLAATAKQSEARAAIDLLRASVGLEEFQPVLVAAITDSPDWSRRLALRIVRKTAYAPARESVLKWVEDENLNWYALQAIGEIMDASCEAPLLAAYKKIHASRRSWYWYVLFMKMRSAEADRLLLEEFASPYATDRRLLLDALVDRRATGLFDRLCAGLDDEKVCNIYARAAAELADAKTILRLLDMLDLPEGHRRNSVRWGLSSTRDPGAQREVLARLQKESRTTIRKDLLAIVTDYSFVKNGAAGLEPILEKISRSPEDPLAAEAAAHLARMKGREGVPQAEEAFLAADAPSWTLIAWLSQYPSDRLVERVGKLAAENKDGGYGIQYLENLGSEKARKELQRIRALQKDGTSHESFSGRFSALEDGGRNKSIDELQHLLTEYEKRRRIPKAEEEYIRTCGLGEHHDGTGSDVLIALAYRKDRALIPLFLTHLKDPEFDLQGVAIRALGKLGAKEAVPVLRQLVRSGDLRTRSRAVRALGAIGGPGTAEFLKSQLRDNPLTAPFALARLGCDCRADVELLLDDAVDKGPILGALDVMANPGIYRNLDTPLPPRSPTQIEAFASLIERVLGTPCRVSPGVRRMLRSHDYSCSRVDAETLREALEDMGEVQGYAGERFTTLFRNGVIELCLVDEALEFWKAK